MGWGRGEGEMEWKEEREGWGNLYLEEKGRERKQLVGYLIHHVRPTVQLRSERKKLSEVSSTA